MRSPEDPTGADFVRPTLPRERPQAKVAFCVPSCLSLAVGFPVDRWETRLNDLFKRPKCNFYEVPRQQPAHGPREFRPVLPASSAHLRTALRESEHFGPA